MTTRKTYDEANLLKQLQRGNHEAFTELYFTYSTHLYCNILKMVKDSLIAEEILQEVFASIWQKRESLVITGGLEPYLYRMTQHRVCDYFRKLSRDRKLLERFKQLVSNSYEPVEEHLFYQESRTYLVRALSMLTPQQKKVYELCKLEGQSYKQAAAQLGISPFTVKEYLSLATKTVREYFGKYFDVS